ncbi:MAG: CHASE2 and HATPase_c domain-containing protein [Oligoflexia bacterium]|nr:CHASE2 and HATPase_c domain-containing protein [Oligoflexia bacterium]
MWDFKSYLRRNEKLLLILAASAGLTGMLLNFDFGIIEAGLYDLRVSRARGFTADPDIVLVTLDDATTKALDEFAPLALDSHALFLEAAERLEPRAVGYVIDFNQVSQANPGHFQGDWATRFVKAAERLQDHGTPVVLGTPYDVTGEVLPPYPLSSLPHSLAVVHKDGNVFGEDKVTRRALLTLDGKPAFHLELARALDTVKPDWLPTGAYSVPEVEGWYFLFQYHGNTAHRPDVGTDQLGGYPRVSFYDILRNKLPPKALRGKTLLVGTLSKDNSSDWAFTPYSKIAFSSPKLVLHANILDSLTHRESIVPAPRWLNALLTFGVAVFVLWWVLNSSPLAGVFATIALAGAFFAVSGALYRFQGIWLRESQPLIAIILGYYLAVPYRLIREYKKRWDYQRKNQLLIQVEELKTNFLSLVTHDLKTPVARIQGLAEVLLRKASDRLLDRDKETIHHIIGSTEELNRFISSILELHKVESKRMQLSLESRDINQLIERSLESFKAPARAKQIELAVSLEPLFPIRIDSTLISKVLNNLIDNALKYSPAGSRIAIESREVADETGEWVEISVADQGFGMTEEELQSLFTRFYRAKNEATSTVAGTGLGLYLTRYFVEMHQGKVEVRSGRNEGSSFRIKLPIHATGPAHPAFNSERKPARAPLASIFDGLLARMSSSLKARTPKATVPPRMEG